MYIAGVGKALPPHCYGQQAVLGAICNHWGERLQRGGLLARLHRNVQVEQRYLALPLEDYRHLGDFGRANDTFLQVGLELGDQAVRDALELAAVPRERVGAFFFTTVTGIATPSLDARLIDRLELPDTIKRIPMFGLGCVAGTAGISRAADYVRAWPEQAALLLSVELCSLTVQLDDFSVANLIATGLFGDGAACAVVLGEELAKTLDHCRSPRVLATRSVHYPASERMMGWDVGSTGFRLVLSPQVPDLVRSRLGHDVDAFLAEQGLGRRDISSWVCHPGGPRVLEAVQEALQLSPEDLELSWQSLRQVGNLSSSSVLMVLRETLLQRRPEPGTRGMMLALGPGFCSELVLLGW